MALVPDGSDVVAFLGRDGDSQLEQTANEHARIVALFVRAYTRGIGFSPSTGDIESADVADDLAAVILTSTARLVTNPAQVEREAADGWSASGAFAGFSLAELFVLNSYRRRSA